jgi:hypothetical protein
MATRIRILAHLVSPVRVAPILVYSSSSPRPRQPPQILVFAHSLWPRPCPGPRLGKILIELLDHASS